MPEYREVNWDKAECWDSNLEMFYDVEEERNAYAYNYINAVRSICARCPIFRDCLTYSFEHEKYGVWGGLTSVERKAMNEPNAYPAQRRRALLDLLQYGITQEQVESCLKESKK
jgi:WhiB family redox-sensing transcriptional regulator